MSSIARPVARSVSRSVLAGQGVDLGYLIRSMFANGEQGFAYDPNDLSTMWQDAAGTVPVTGAGQPVGFVLDKSKGLVLGTEIISGGNFEGGLMLNKIDTPSAISTWTLNTNNPISGLQDGLLSVTQAAPTRPALYAPSPQSKQGMYEEVSFDYKVISGSVNVSGVYSGGGVTVINKALSGTGRFSHRYFRSETDTGIYIYFGNTLGSLQIDNVSVKQILGNHAYQTTSSMRPLLVASPQRLDYDTVDDKLITTLPIQLTGCTVIRSVPNVGTQILTGQTIPTPYNDNTDHCGLIVINRALTATETSQITAIFNKAAGV